MSQNNNETITPLPSRVPYVYHGKDGEVVPQNITSLTFHPSVTHIKDFAFHKRRALEKVTFSNTLQSIGKWAFCGCISLKITKFPDSLESINDWAFMECTSLTITNFPKFLKTIGNGAFLKCTSLTIHIFPPLLKSIGSYAFQECTSLTAVDFPMSLKNIDARAFSFCTSLMYVNFPSLDSLEMNGIGDEAFRGCISLIVANFPRITDDAHLRIAHRCGDDVFHNCLTLDLRLQQQTDIINNNNRENLSYRAETWLTRRFDDLPIHEMCMKSKLTLDQLYTTISNNEGIIQKTDDLGMTALHVLCLNPKASPEMFKLLVDAYPEARSLEVLMVTNTEPDLGFEISKETLWDYDDEYNFSPDKILDQTCERITPVKLWLQLKGIKCDYSDFNEQSHLKRSRIAVEKGLIKWNDILSMMYIQPSKEEQERKGRNTIKRNWKVGAQGIDDEDQERQLYSFMQVSGCGEQNLESKLYLFMQAATVGEENLETVYRLALYNPTLIYEPL